MAQWENPFHNFERWQFRSVSVDLINRFSSMSLCNLFDVFLLGVEFLTGTCQIYIIEIEEIFIRISKDFEKQGIVIFYKHRFFYEFEDLSNEISRLHNRFRMIFGKILTDSQLKSPTMPSDFCDQLVKTPNADGLSIVSYLLGFGVTNVHQGTLQKIN